MNISTGQRAEYTIRWVLTHDPIALFAEAARRFAEIIALETHGRMHVQVMTPTEYGNGHRVSAEQVADDLAAGKIEMSQTYTTTLGQRHDLLWVLDLPYLFRNHQHAAEVLDGDVGMSLLEGLLPHSIRGLAFTYSGGYRIVSATAAELHALKDFSGFRIRISDNPVAAAFFRHMGANVHPAPLQAIPELTAAGVINAAESTWPRYWDMQHYQSQKSVMETFHSLFLTALLVNESFFQSLPADLKTILKSAAIRTARLERSKSVRDGESARDNHLADAGVVVSPSAVLESRMMDTAALVYREFSSRFGSGLMRDILRKPDLTPNGPSSSISAHRDAYTTCVSTMVL